MKLNASVVALWAQLACVTAATAQTVAPMTPEVDAVVLRAGPVALSKAEYEKLVPGFDRSAGAPLTGPSPQSQKSGQEVARLLAMAEEAKRRGIDKDPKVSAILQVRSYTILANALLARLVEEAKKDEAGSRAVWAQQGSQFQELSVRQILIRHQGAAPEQRSGRGLTRSEAQAKALAEKLQSQLRQGADFATLARQQSDDETTRAQGGSLPPFTRGAMEAEFESASFALQQPGAVSEPVKTRHGYHLIQLVERKPFAFERVRSNIEFMRAKEKMEQIATSGIELNPAYFKP